MLHGPEVVAALRSSGVSHVVWLPDSYLGRWQAALTGPEGLPLLRVCREGEALALAGGLLLGGQHPVVMLQCTGLFEAGDALRNIVHDLRLPLFLIVGVRSWKKYQQDQAAGRPSEDTCPVFLEGIVAAWRLDSTWLREDQNAQDLAAIYQRSRAIGKAHCVLLAE